MPSHYVPLQALEYPPKAAKADQDESLSSQSLVNDDQLPGNSRPGFPAHEHATGQYDEGEVDVVRIFRRCIRIVLTVIFSSRFHFDVRWS
jgi:hypothetical protein